MRVCVYAVSVVIVAEKYCRYRRVHRLLLNEIHQLKDIKEAAATTTTEIHVWCVLFFTPFYFVNVLVLSKNLSVFAVIFLAVHSSVLLKFFET